VLILSEQLSCRTEEAQEEMDGMVEAAKGLSIRVRRDNGSAAEVADMLQSGMKQSQIAAKLGVSRQRIGQIVQEIHAAVAAAKAAAADAGDDKDDDEDDKDEDEDDEVEDDENEEKENE
jgi:transcriptional regulator with XRE-family HTH domain